MINHLKDSDSFFLELQSKGLELVYLEDKSKFDELISLHKGDFWISPLLYNVGGSKLFFTQQVGSTIVAVFNKSSDVTRKVAEFCVRRHIVNI